MDKPRGALYLKKTPGHTLAGWIGIGLNLACVVACARWSSAHFGDVRPGWPLLSAAALAGLLASDFYTGFVHWLTDTWLDERSFDRVACIAREHHIYPQHVLDYTLWDYVAYMCFPTTVVFGPLCVLLTAILPPCAPVYFAVLVVGQVSFLMFFGTHFHRLGHRQSKSRLVRLLQKGHLLITPKYHARHHSGAHDDNYCVVNGWMNPILDRTGFWRGLERVVHALTGAVPRESEGEWTARYREDPSFMLDPLPSLLKLRAAGRAPSPERGRAASGGSRP